MIVPSAINVLIVGAMMVVFGFLWRMLSAHLHNGSVGQAMAAIY